MNYSGGKFYGKLLNKHTDGKRFDEDTITMLRDLIGFRLEGWSFKAIGEYFEVSKARINNLEKTFLKSLNKTDKKEYNELVETAKKERRHIK